MGLPASYPWRNLCARPVRALLTAGAIGLVVLSAALLAALVGGIKGAFVNTGDPANLVVLRKGADTETSSWMTREAVQIIRALDGVAHDDQGRPLVSPELIVQPALTTKGGASENVLVRGVHRQALQVHREIHLVEGRAPAPGTGEAIVGRSVVRRYANVGMGHTLRFGRRAWKVVGVFEAGGASFESEIWVDAGLLAADARRALPYSAVYLRTANPSQQDALISRIDADKRFPSSAHAETRYYEKRAETANALYVLLAVIGLLAGASAMLGATNTLHAAVSARTREIGTLRALGFAKGAVVRSLLWEALLLGVAGFALGAIAAWCVTLVAGAFGYGIGVPTSTFTTLVVDLSIQADDLLVPLLLACAIGLFGGLAPALRAAALRPVDALRKV